MKLVCLICDKELKELHQSTTDEFSYPIINNGGHVEITFGYGSGFDDLESEANAHLTLICDECYKKACDAGKITHVIKTQKLEVKVVQ